MFTVLIKRTCQGLYENILTPIKFEAPRTSCRYFLTDNLAISDFQRLQAVACRCRRGTFAF